MDKAKIIRLVELVYRREGLEKNDTEKESVLESNPYAIADGYVSRNMEEIERINKEIEELN